ncbi:MFS transporter [Saccharicrinis sp. FJH62]|uniref:MFS transporter n=1 Tax=Saccharicrinis sp. FJH62 TaxID=3344657 RepID=UPI0035D4D37C
MAEKGNNKIIALLFTGVLMGALDISIVGPALPAIQSTIAIQSRLLGWVFSIYVLFNLTGISFFAKLSDNYGRRNIYVLSLLIFALGSLIVSLSDNFTVLIVGRAVQGFGASGIFPVASAVVGDLFPVEKRGRILGLLGAVFGFAFIIGPILAGTLLKFFSWHALFLINIPIAAVLVFYSIKLLPNIRTSKDSKIDYPGIILMALMLGSFAYAVNNLESEGLLASLKQWKVFPFLIGSVVFLVLLFLTEHNKPNAVVKTHLFKNRQIRIVGLIAIVSGAMQSVFVFIPDFTVKVFGVNSSQASFMLVPIVLASAVGSPLFGRLIDKIGSKWVILLGLALSAGGFYILYAFKPERTIFYTAGALIGLGLSILAGSSLRYIMLNEVGKTDRAITQGMLSIFTSLGQLTGAAIIGAMIASVGEIGFNRSFYYLALLIIVALVFALRLKNHKKELATKAEE